MSRCGSSSSSSAFPRGVGLRLGELGAALKGVQMDLGTVYGIISSLGTLISALEKLIATLKAHGVDVPQDIHTNLAAARDAHTQLVATNAAVNS